MGMSMGIADLAQASSLVPLPRSAPAMQWRVHGSGNGLTCSPCAPRPAALGFKLAEVEYAGVNRDAQVGGEGVKNFCINMGGYRYGFCR